LEDGEEEIAKIDYGKVVAEPKELVRIRARAKDK